MNNIVTGRKGEERIVTYLESKGYVILEKNFRFHHKEVDIIALKNKTLIFVEVKARKNKSFGSGFESVTSHKIKNIISVARYYIHKNRLYNLNVRFDVASIDTDGLSYVEDAFQLKSSKK